MIRNPEAIEVKDEGATQGRARTFDFVGAGVTAAVSGQTATITISGGGGGGGTWTEVEVDFGTVPAWDALFTITDAAIGASSKVDISESGKAATGRVAGDAQWDSILCAALPAAGSASVYAQAFPGPVVGKRKLHYTVA